MATILVHCPTCKGQVSLDAEACPKCGQPINPKTLWDVIYPVHRWTIYFLLGSAGVASVCGIIYFVLGVIHSWGR